MKICAIICEYNPFHNGHLYHLNAAREHSGADAIVCFMSGNFVQRGESAISDKYTRARHAVLAGADAVIELPAVYSTSNAELFAKGAVQLLSSIPAVQTLCFGAETANKAAFLLAARYLNDEPKEVSDKIKAELTSGASYARARAQAWAGFIPFDLLTSPNNVLGLEYTKALQALGSTIEILPICRTGAGYSEERLQSDYSSATAIRAAIRTGEIFDGNLPDFVRKDLPPALETRLDALEKYAILSTPKEEIARVCDCTEGLENAFKRAALLKAPLAQTLTTARYTASRIRRIALQNLLKIDENSIRRALLNPLYLNVLAIKKERKELLSALGESTFPLLIRPRDEETLCEIAKKTLEIDRFADHVYNLLYEVNEQEKNVFI
ncbi:MAG: nucleotidyltransferase family protein [Clostridia bacterium]|nr:nucleotidyltransferase family protein [Clostridia bacterium]